MYQPNTLSHTLSHSLLSHTPYSLTLLTSYNKMASTAFMKTVQNGMNDIVRDAYTSVLTCLDNEKLLTAEIRTLIEKMVDDVKTNKKISKTSKPRISGYHLYMREHRKVVKAEQPDITPQQMTSVLAKAWKDVPEEKKEDYKERAKQSNTLASDSEGISSGPSDTESTDAEPSTVQESSIPESDGAKKETKKKASKTTKKSKVKQTESEE